MPRILLVDDEASVRRTLGKVLRDQGFDVQTAGSGREALALLQNTQSDVAIVDYQLRRETGDTLTRALLEIDPTLMVIGFTGQEQVGVAHSFLSAGARQCFEKGADQQRALFDEIKYLLSIQNEERQDRTRAIDFDERTVSPRVRKALGKLAAKSPAMRQLRSELLNLASMGYSGTVLLRGEPGVGKSHAAGLLHAAWAPEQSELVEFNAAGFTRDTVGPTLFGSKGGVFTGVGDNEGALGATRDGTLFLDEIGDLPPDVQASLLRLLQDRTYTRVGDSRKRRFEGRLVVATNRDLDAMVAAGDFRRDLRDRLVGLEYVIPPLRARRADILHLSYSFMSRYQQAYNRQVRHIPAETRHLLETHRWPGNVRELEQVIERAVIRCGHSYLEPRYLSFRGGHQPVDDAPPAPPADRPASAPTAPVASGGAPFASRFDQPYTEAKNAVIGEFTRAYVRELLTRANGNKTLAAEYAGLKPPNLHRLIRKFEIDTSDLSGDREVRGGRRR